MQEEEIREYRRKIPFLEDGKGSRFLFYISRYFWTSLVVPRTSMVTSEVRRVSGVIVRFILPLLLMPMTLIWYFFRMSSSPMVFPTHSFGTEIS